MGLARTPPLKTNTSRQPRQDTFAPSQAFLEQDALDSRHESPSHAPSPKRRRSHSSGPSHTSRQPSRQPSQQLSPGPESIPTNVPDRADEVHDRRDAEGAVHESRPTSYQPSPDKPSKRARKSEAVEGRVHTPEIQEAALQQSTNEREDGRGLSQQAPPVLGPAFQTPRATRTASYPHTAEYADASDDSIEVDHQLASGSDAGPSEGPSQSLVTPRRSSRYQSARTPARTPGRTPAQVLATPAVPVQDPGVREAEYGKHYENLVRTLQFNVVDKRLSRWTLDDLKECYPLLASEVGSTMADVWENTSHAQREATLKGAYHLLNEYKVAKRLRTLAQVIDNARTHAAEHPGEGRPDAWRPDLTPWVISAGTNLQEYDMSWAQLRDEYRALTERCAARVERVQSKQRLLEEMDSGVSDSVVELSKTNALLKGFPPADMLTWAEEIQAKLQPGTGGSSGDIAGE